MMVYMEMKIETSTILKILRTDFMDGPLLLLNYNVSGRDTYVPPGRIVTETE